MEATSNTQSRIPLVTPIILPGNKERIESLEAQIAKLEQLLRYEKELQSHIDTINSNGISSTFVENNSKPPRGVGEFILNYLEKNPKAETKDIIKQYAQHIHDNPENVRNNVSNTLSRLKSSKLVKNRPNPGGRRFGSKWFLTSNAQSN